MNKRQHHSAPVDETRRSLVLATGSFAAAGLLAGCGGGGQGTEPTATNAMGRATAQNASATNFTVRRLPLRSPTAVYPDSGVAFDPSAILAVQAVTNPLVGAQTNANQLFISPVHAYTSGAAALVRALKLSLAGPNGTALAVGATYAVTGSTLALGGLLLVNNLSTGANYSYGASSGSAKITALSATKVTLAFNNFVVDAAAAGSTGNSGSGSLRIDGSITLDLKTLA